MNKAHIYKFMDLDNIPIYLFCLGCVCKDFTKDEIKEIAWNGNVYDYSNNNVQISKKMHIW